VNGPGAEWTQFGLHPPLYAIFLVVFKSLTIRNKNKKKGLENRVLSRA
jgi:hypothetical protein